MEWTDPETLARTLGISRATFYRKVQGGQIEASEVAGRRLYRAVNGVPVKSQSHSVSRDEMSARETPNETDRTAVLALVERYETRIEALLAERREVDQARIEAERAATEARERAAALSADVKRARVELEHARKLADLEIGNLEALGRAKLDDAERIAQEERQRREVAEAALALESLPWWRLGQWRHVRALLTACAAIGLGLIIMLDGESASSAPPRKQNHPTQLLIKDSQGRIRIALDGNEGGLTLFDEDSRERVKVLATKEAAGDSSGTGARVLLSDGATTFAGMTVGPGNGTVNVFSIGENGKSRGVSMMLDPEVAALNVRRDSTSVVTMADFVGAGEGPYVAVINKDGKAKAVLGHAVPNGSVGSLTLMNDAGNMKMMLPEGVLESPP